MNVQKYGMIFQTKDNKYYYDTATGKVVLCDDSEVEIIDRILSGKTV